MVKWNDIPQKSIVLNFLFSVESLNTNIIIAHVGPAFDDDTYRTDSPPFCIGTQRKRKTSNGAHAHRARVREGDSPNKE